MAISITEDFDRRTSPYRRELLAHCYQMLGSVHDAEDLLQETLLRAWRAFDRFDERRASLRTWLHRIATNACLTALETRSRRPLPSGLGAPTDDPGMPLAPADDVPWLQPLPDALVGADPNDPAAILLSRGTLRLALVAAMQSLPARQRAILILREVLDWPAAEVAEALGTTTAAVNSGLQRARARLAEAGIREEQVDEPADPDRRVTLDRYVAAFENADVAGLTRLLTDDVTLEMPPVPGWFAGREHYARFMERVFAMRGPDWRMSPVGANGQPAVAAYALGKDGAYHLHTLQVFTVTGSRVSGTVVFQDAGVFAAFRLPPVLDAAGRAFPSRA